MEVALKRIGTSSVTFLLELSQAGHRAGTVDLVVAQVDAGRAHAVPLSPAQRAALQAIPGQPGPRARAVDMKLSMTRGLAPMTSVTIDMSGRVDGFTDRVGDQLDGR